MERHEADRHLVRTARALLDWKQSDLASAAGIALATLKRFEKGLRTPIPTIYAAIFRALTEAGIEFTTDAKRVGVSLPVKKLPK